MSKPHILLAHRYWKDLITQGDIAVDMTCGNGHDTLVLSELGATVYGFDIQLQAIENTRMLVPNAHLFHQSHDDLPELPTPRLIVYNLGYLPGGDKSIVTKVESTLKSIAHALEILAPGGALSIMCYPGHEEGEREESAVLEYAKTLPFSVCYHQWINRAKSPTLIWIVKEERAAKKAAP